MTIHLHLLHTNDLHGQYDRWLRQAALIRQRKAELEAQGKYVLLVDAGDHMDFSINECIATNGHLHLQMLAELGVQAFVPGNNELLRTPVPLIRELSLTSKVPWLLANLREADGSPLGGMRDTLLLDFGAGLKIGLCGVTDQFADSYEQKHGLKNRDTLSALQQAAAELRAQGATLLVLLSHLGDEADSQVAEALPGLFDLIVGSHSHTVLHQPRERAGTIIVQAGALGQYVGEVVLELEEQTGRLVRCSGQLHEMTEAMPADEAQAQLLADARAQSESYLNEVLTTLEQPLTHEHLVARIADSLRAFWETEIGMIVGAAAVDGVPAGPLTRGAVLSICRSMILLAKTEVTGAQVLHLIRESLDPAIYQRNVYGQGIRPNPLPIGQVAFSGVTWQEVDGQPFDVQVNGEPLAADRVYTAGIGANLLFAEMSHYTALTGSPILDREKFFYAKDVWIEYLQKNGTTTFSRQNA